MSEPAPLHRSKPDGGTIFRYGFYGAGVYLASLAVFIGSAAPLLIWAWQGGPSWSGWLGLGLFGYGVLSTAGWLMARYVIPGTPVGVARDVIDHLRLGGHERVLDVGTGRGLFAIEVASRLNSGSVVGIDLWEPEKTPWAGRHHKWAQPTGNTLANAQRNAQEQRVADRIQFLNMDAGHLDFPSNSFDLVICAYVLGHLGPYAERVLEQVHGVLKPEGKLLVIDNVRDVTFFLMSTPHLFALSYLRDKKAKRLTRTNWHSSMARAGFQIQKAAMGRGIITIVATPGPQAAAG